MANQRSECLKLTKNRGKKTAVTVQSSDSARAADELNETKTAVHVDAALRNQQNLLQSAGASIQFTCTD